MISVENGLATLFIYFLVPTSTHTISFSFLFFFGMDAGSLLLFQILLLNGWHDREIHGYTAIDTVNAVCSSLNRKQSESSVNQRTSSSNNGACALDHEASTYITHLLVPRGGSVYSPSSDNPALAELGIKVVEVDSSDPEGNGQFRFDANALVEGIDAIVSGKS